MCDAVESALDALYELLFGNGRSDDSGKAAPYCRDLWEPAYIGSHDSFFFSGIFRALVFSESSTAMRHVARTAFRRERLHESHVANRDCSHNSKNFFVMFRVKSGTGRHAHGLQKGKQQWNSTECDSLS